MFTAIFTVLGLGLLLLIAVGAIVLGLLAKGAKALFLGRHRHFTSSDIFGGHFRHHGHGHHGHYGHHTYGHMHYKHKHSHSSGFFFSS